LSVDDCAFLLDVGQGTIRRLMEAGTSIFSLTSVLFSHLHPDHTGELASLLFSTKYTTNARRSDPLTLIAGEGFASFYRRLANAYGPSVTMDPDMLRIRELSVDREDGCAAGPVSIKSMPVAHTEESLAYRITLPDGRSIVYSGDTDACDNLVDLAQHADLLICESSFPDELKVEGHLTPGLAGEIADKAGVEKLVLTHFYPECESADLKAQCRRSYKGPLVLATDLMRVAI